MKSHSKLSIHKQNLIMQQLVRIPILLQRALSPTELKRRQALHTTLPGSRFQFSSVLSVSQFCLLELRRPEQKAGFGRRWPSCVERRRSRSDELYELRRTPLSRLHTSECQNGARTADGRDTSREPISVQFSSISSVLLLELRLPEMQQF